MQPADVHAGAAEQNIDERQEAFDLPGAHQMVTGGGKYKGTVLLGTPSQNFEFVVENQVRKYAVSKGHTTPPPFTPR